MQPMVSIIVPVYNAEKYLNKCIDSVLNQDYKDIELILLDDGSKDSSPAICDSYTSDARVRVIHKSNSGVSDTRNKGISEAKGKYIQFMDSDDWITADATGSLVKCAETTGADMVVADFYRVVDDRAAQKGGIDSDDLLTLEEYAEAMMENPADFYFGVLWNKLYKREIIEKYGIHMDPEVKWCEDFLFNLEYAKYCKTISPLKTPIYYYVKRKGSLVAQNISLSKTVNMKTMCFEYYQDFYKNVFSEEEYKKKKNKLYRFLIDVADDGVAEPTLMPKSYKLGKERVSAEPEIENGRGFFAEAYRKRIIFEQKLQSAALKNSLTLIEAEILYCIDRIPEIHSLKLLKEVLGYGTTEIYAGLVHLGLLGLVADEEKGWTIKPAAAEILKDFEAAEALYEKMIE